MANRPTKAPAHLFHGHPLGKLAARHDARTLMLAHYTTPKLAPPPESVDWSKKAKAWPGYWNDTLADCTVAAAAHQIEAWTSQSGKAVTLDDKPVLKAYEDVSGWNPKTGKNADAGAVVLDVLKYWRRTGIGGHKIVGFTAIEPGNHAHVKQSVALFGGCYLGLLLPASAKGQKMWTLTPGGKHGPGAPGSWGGHAVNVVGYDREALTVVSWGALLRMTWTFWDAYCDEAYALVSRDFIGKGTKAPSGLDLKQMINDLGGL
ncbi:MAG: hypothetical protein JST92_03600 [Deltaproteobacteria bacterium]|nr:hypothetical protein [Deltaproteobacteria bacterium]